MNAKTLIAVAVVATALFSGSALAVSGNPENPNASTKNWQLDELRQSVNNQFSDVNNRIDQIQAGSSFDASDIYDHLDTHDKQIGDLNIYINGLDDQVSNIGSDVNELKDRVITKVDKDDFLKDQQKQNDRMDGMQDRIDNNSGRLDAVENGLNHAERLLDTVENKLDYTSHLAQRATDKAQEAADKANQALEENVEQDAQIADLQLNKVDRSELEDVAIKADGALAGAIENRNQIDQIRGDLADTDKQVTTNKKDIADLKNQNGVLNNAVANAQDTANTASDKADKAQSAADKAAVGVNNVKNDVKVVSRDVANNSIRIQRNEERIDGAYAGIYDNRKNIEANHRAINENTKAIQQLNRNFNDLRDKVERNNKDMKRGVAGAAALAGMPQVGQYEDFMVSAGVGHYKGETAVAVGASGRINSNVVVKGGVAFTSGEAVINGGVGIAW